jgi:hypothetical protein
VTKTWRVRAFAALITALPMLAIPVAAAEGAHITDIQHVNDRWDKVSVFSPDRAVSHPGSRALS